MRPLLIPILCALFLTACHKHKNDDPEPKANLSVLVYIAGDCNLDASYYDYEEQRTINFVDEDIVDDVKDAAEDIADTVADKAADLADAVGDAVEDVADAVEDAVEDLKD